MKSRRRFLHLSSFSDSNSFMTAGPDYLRRRDDIVLCTVGRSAIPSVTILK